jgi:hypothetical protein
MAGKLGGMVAAAALFAAGSVQASVIWDGDASKGTGVFKLIGTGNCIGEGSSSLTVVDDAAQGRVWRYHKPSDSNRCENHGIKNGSTNVVFANGQLRYLGWRFKLSTIANNNANFQWKSYGSGHQQNFPLVLKMVSNQVHYMHTAPGGASTYIWKKSISANQWNHIVLAININSTSGWTELWWNGAKQTMIQGGQRYNGRTWDVGNHNCPKWGVYGGSGSTMTNYVDGLKVGTTFGDVD